MEKVIKSERHQAALEYALEQIKNSPLRPYVQATFLYGSCSRGEEKYSSDVDLLLVLNENLGIEYSKDIAVATDHRKVDDICDEIIQKISEI